MKTSIRRLAALGIAVVMGVSIVGCSGTTATVSTSESAPAQESVKTDETASEAASSSGYMADTVTIAVAADPGNLNPFASVYNCTTNGLEEALFYNPVRGGMEPQIAYSLEQLDDYTVQIKIYDDVYDSDGNHFTASDAIFSIETCAHHDGGPGYFEMYDSCELIDDYTFNIKMTDAVVNIYFNIITKVPMITEKAWNEHDMSTDPVETGPYKLVSYVPGASLTMVANENYWGINSEHRQPISVQNVRQINYVFMSESSQTSIALENNEIDMAFNLDETEVERFKAMDGFTVTSKPSTKSSNIYFSGVDSIFTDIRCRQAVAYAINVDQVIALACGVGKGEKCYTWTVNNAADFQERWKELDNYSYDLDKAKELMTEAGYDVNGSMDITLLTSTDARDVATAVAVQSMLSEIGLNVSIVSYDWSTMNSYLHDPATYDLAIRPCGNDFIYQNIQSFFDQRKNYRYGGTITGLIDDEFQEALERAEAVATSSEDTINDMVNVFQEHCLGYMMYQWEQYYVHDDAISNIETDPSYGIHAGAFIYGSDFQAAN